MIIEKLHQYTQGLSGLTPWEREFVTASEKSNYLFAFLSDKLEIPSTLENLFSTTGRFQGLLREHSEALCVYLSHIQELTCNTGIIRIDVRSLDLSNYRMRIIHAIGAFFIFYGAGLSLRELIYGSYKDTLQHSNMSPIIAAELLRGNEEAAGYCRDVLTSENNIGFLTRDVIIAIEQSKDQELQDLLTSLLIAAKLQEGVRQSILETADENQLDHFLRLLDVIKEENLLRYSSVQRSLLTWVGIGCEKAGSRQPNAIFDSVHRYLHDGSARKAALSDEDPLNVYLALYALGARSLEKALSEAAQLIESAPRHVIAAALIYLKLTRHFPIVQYMYLLQEHSDDPWITALYLSECVENDPTRMGLTAAQCRQLFDSILPFMSRLKTQHTVISKGFDWFALPLYQGAVASFLLELLIQAPDTERIEQFLPYVPSMSQHAVEDFFSSCFSYVSLPLKKKFMIREIISQQEFLCNIITKELSKTALTQEDIASLEGRLKTKKAYARAAIVQVLAEQPEQTVRESAARLSLSENKLIRGSAEELRRLRPSYFGDTARPGIAVLGIDDGFGLYQRYQRYAVPQTSFLKVNKNGLLKDREIPDLSFLNVWSKEKLLSYLSLWNSRIEEHAHDEYERYGTQCLVGDKTFYPLDYGKASLDALPLGEVWRSYFRTDGIDPDVVFQLHFVLESLDYTYEGIFKDEVQLVTLTPQEFEQFTYGKHIICIIGYYFRECGENHAYLEKAAQVAELFLKYAKSCAYKTYNYQWFPYYRQGQPYYESIGAIAPFQTMLQELTLGTLDDEIFRCYFPLVYQCYLRFHMGCVQASCGVVVENKMTLEPLVMARACAMGLLPRSALMELILDKHCEGEKLRWDGDDLLISSYQAAYFSGRGIYGKPHLELPEEQREAVCYLRETLDEITEALIQMETTRLNSTTAVTKYISRLYVVRGIRYLLLALKMLDGEDIKRAAHGDDPQSVFCNIIRRSYPLPEDTVHELKAAGISEKHLVEVAMMAPQWIDLVNEVLGWDGFKEGCYYFIAHMKQDNSEQKKAEISHYTDLDPADLSDGACDIQWCRSIYARLGEKRIKVLYDASRLLCDNSFHTRARKYLDACTGKLSREECCRQAAEKRSKDALNAYCLIPIQNEQDLLERYLYIQQFLKGSKEHGAQRQASEKRCCEIALMNLARNAGCGSVDRMVWQMESKMTDQYQDVLCPTMVDGVQLCIAVDENGKAEISVTENGKKLRSIPARLKNNGYVLRLKEAHRLFTQQYRRTRSMLEKAMEDGSEFDSSEIAVMAGHKIAGPLLRRLVLCCGEFYGFYQDGELVMGEQSTPCTGTVHIAHCVELYQHQQLRGFQEHIFANEIVQPFKQVFRELYLKLEEELPLDHTMRYTGYQIQTRQAAGALKNRGWNVSYDGGLEKVCYKYNAVVHLYADADWFSPSDIEAPSIDHVAFSQRKDGQPLLIERLNDTMFSEVMRDVDMAVSLSFVGGVDPVTSASTLELRQSIVSCTCRMMKLTNVRVEGHFAHIAGKYNDYSVHLGSGMIHQRAGGSIHMVPIWSCHRGKVYLPFLDEDPLTAQIVSKVILLADDTSIKDPEILRQIQRRQP